MLRRIIATAFLVGATWHAAWAADAPHMRDAHPALWTVHSAKGTAYLFGSIHILPADVHWRSPEVEKAIEASDTFVFEIPMDQGSQVDASAYILKNGFLPQGQSLRAMLPPAQQPRYDSVVAASGMNAQAVDRMQPWLASIALTVSSMKTQSYDVNLGPDMVLSRDAGTENKPALAFETVTQQLELLAPTDEKTNMEALSAALDDIIDQPHLADDMLAAWMTADTAKLEALLNANIDKYPGARKVLLDDRNANWVGQLKTMMKSGHTYFVTVGAGHLVGPKGVPALLRAAGYEVDGP
jgi:uncharacterized protein